MTKQIQYLPCYLEFAVNVLPRMCNVQINNNTNFIDCFSFPINDLFFQLSICFKVDQIKKAVNFSEITFILIKNFRKCLNSSNVNQYCPTRSHKSEYRSLGLSWLSTLKFLRSYCIKSLNLLQMVSLITKKEQEMRTLVTTLSNHFSSNFKLLWVPFTPWIFLQIVRSSFEK